MQKLMPYAAYAAFALAGVIIGRLSVRDKDDE